MHRVAKSWSTRSTKVVDLSPKGVWGEIMAGRTRAVQAHATSREKAEERSRKKLAAIKVQTAYRLLRITYLKFGPSIFCKHDGNAAPHGELVFTRGMGLQHKAKWICLAESTKMTVLCHFVERYWRLTSPDLVIDVTGSTADLKLDPLIADKITDGLDAVLRTTSCWVLTGGFDEGLPRLVGQAARISGVKVPVIGVCAWSAVKGRDALSLDGCLGESVTYNTVQLAQITKERIANGTMSKYQANKLYLNGDHSHFLFVDTKEGSVAGQQQHQRGKAAYAMGGSGLERDTNLRARFVDAYTDRKHLPVVTLVVQGDPGMLDGVLAAARGRTPIILVVGSGGCADAIHRALFGEVQNDGTAEDEGNWVPMDEEMSTVDAALFATPSVRLKLQELVELHRRYDSVLVTAYDWQKDDEASLSIVMLEAIVRVLCLGSNNSRQPSTPSPFASPSASPVLVPMEATATKEEDSTDGVLAVDALASALKLAINWDRPQIVRALVERKLSNEADRSVVLKQALQRAVERQRHSIVELLLDLNAPLEKINLLPLYTQPDQYNFLADAELRNALGSRSREDAYRGIAEFLGDISPLLESLALERVKQPGGVDGPAESLDKEVVAGAMEQENEASQNLAQPDAARDIFCWAVLCGHDDLMRVVWRRCKDPLHLAIIGAFLARHQAERIAVGQQEVSDRADRLEQWACGALDKAPNSETAYKVLSAPATSRHFGPLLDLALECEMKNFLSQ